MTEIDVFKTFGKGEKTEVLRGINAVIYTRVSSKDQVENLSLSTQRKACLHYAQKHGHNVLQIFGGTNESAQTDERKEFTLMINFVKKSREKVSFILVASLERFSRNDNAIWLDIPLILTT
jgi:site-specific DNA recombinase